MRRKTISLIALILMIVFSFAGILPLLGISIPNFASVTLLIGIIAYFVTRNPKERNGFSFKAIPGFLKDWKIDILLVMPLIMDLASYLIAKAVLPDFLIHLADRISFLSFGTVFLLIAELIIAALGEEIAWRGFFQTRLATYIPFPAALVIMAFLFAICHVAAGNLGTVLYDLFFIFVNALFYGLLYKKTENIWMSTLAHFMANLFGVFGLFLIL